MDDTIALRPRVVATIVEGRLVYVSEADRLMGLRSQAGHIGQAAE